MCGGNTIKKEGDEGFFCLPHPIPPAAALPSDYSLIILTNDRGNRGTATATEWEMRMYRDAASIGLPELESSLIGLIKGRRNM